MTRTFTDLCDVCRTAQHCEHHGRCLAECTPADLAASLAPPEAAVPQQEVESRSVLRRKAAQSGVCPVCAKPTAEASSRPLTDDFLNQFVSALSNIFRSSQEIHPHGARTVLRNFAREIERPTAGTALEGSAGKPQAESVSACRPDSLAATSDRAAHSLASSRPLAALLTDEALKVMFRRAKDADDWTHDLTQTANVLRCEILALLAPHEAAREAQIRRVGEALRELHGMAKDLVIDWDSNEIDWENALLEADAILDKDFCAMLDAPAATEPPAHRKDQR